MKIRAILLIFIIVCIQAAKLHAQNININVKGVALTSVFKEIQYKTTYKFIYTNELINKAASVNVNIANQPLNTALDEIFSGQPLNYTIYNHWVVIKDKDFPPVQEKQHTDTTSTPQKKYSISGTVTDEKGETLPGVIVYINNSTYITSTDNTGKYNFDNIEPGNYQVIAKMIGFIVDIQTVIIENKSISLNNKLSVSNTMLKMVTINGKVDPNRKKYMELFTRNFIGETPNAADCKILNPEVINFDYDKKEDVLNASADDFIIIENRSLGYMLKYTLTMFQYDIKHNIYSATGYPYFEPMQATTSQQKKWDKNRMEAYLGSKRHFIRALSNKTVQKDGFSFLKQIAFGSPKPIDINSILNLDAMDNDSTATMYSFYWNQKLVALFLYRKKPNPVLTGGRWAMQRMADLTPVDYFVENVPDGTTLSPINLNILKREIQNFKNPTAIVIADSVSLKKATPDSTKNNMPNEKPQNIQKDNKTP